MTSDEYMVIIKRVQQGVGLEPGERQGPTVLKRMVLITPTDALQFVLDNVHTFGAQWAVICHDAMAERILLDQENMVE